MTPRMTKEREREIRTWVAGDGPEIDTTNLMESLIAELDAVRAEYEDFQDRSQKAFEKDHEELLACQRELDAVREERDDRSGVHSCHAKCTNPVCVMRRERDEARSATLRMEHAAQDAARERDQLRAENLKMRDAIAHAFRVFPQLLSGSKLDTVRELPHTSLLARKWEAMERVVLEAQRAVESYKGSTPLTLALDALEKEGGR